MYLFPLLKGSLFFSVLCFLAQTSSYAQIHILSPHTTHSYCVCLYFLLYVCVWLHVLHVFLCILLHAHFLCVVSGLMCDKWVWQSRNAFNTGTFYSRELFVKPKLLVFLFIYNPYPDESAPLKPSIKSITLTDILWRTMSKWWLQYVSSWASNQ